MNENEASKVIFDAGLKVHRQLGAGLEIRIVNRKTETNAINL